MLFVLTVFAVLFWCLRQEGCTAWSFYLSSLLFCLFDQIQAALLYSFSSVSLHHPQINLKAKFISNAVSQCNYASSLFIFFPALSVICELFTQSCVSLKYQINNMLKIEIVPYLYFWAQLRKALIISLSSGSVIFVFYLVCWFAAQERNHFLILSM